LRALDWRTLLLLFAGLVLGTAMERTSAAAWMVGWSVPADSHTVSGGTMPRYQSTPRPRPVASSMAPITSRTFLPRWSMLQVTMTTS
jgi:hypothetical protein